MPEFILHLRCHSDVRDRILRMLLCSCLFNPLLFFGTLIARLAVISCFCIIFWSLNVSLFLWFFYFLFLFSSWERLFLQILMCVVGCEIAGCVGHAVRRGRVWGRVAF